MNFDMVLFTAKTVKSAYQVTFLNWETNALKR